MNDGDFSPEQEAAWQSLLNRCGADLDQIVAETNRTVAVSAMLLVSLRAYEAEVGNEALIELLQGMVETAQAKQLLEAEPAGGAH